jgi:hypothetical protein
MKWPRYCELLLALWLLVSPWMWNYSGAAAAVSVGAAAAILTLGITSIQRPYSYAYLGILGVAAGLLAHAFLVSPAGAAATQNHVAVALLLLIFAILPTEATLPPRSWRDHGDVPR